MAELSQAQFAGRIDPTRRTAVRRLRNVYEATPDQVREAGLNWYGKVHDAALKGVADNRKSGRTIRHAAGVIAAVSPNMDWERNNIGAFDEISQMRPEHWDAIRRSAASEGGRTPEAKDALRGLSIATAGDSALIKADRIWNHGEDFEHVLDRRTSPKTNSFAHNILAPHQEGPVTVDGRHADIIADAMRPWKIGRGIASAANKTGKPTRYEHYEDHTRAVARSAGILPHQMQAVVWEHGKQIERNYNPNRKQGDERVGQSYQRRLQSFQEGRG